MFPVPLRFDPPPGWDVVLPAPVPETVTLAPVGPAPASGFRPRIAVTGSIGAVEELSDAARRLARTMQAAAVSARILDHQADLTPPAPVVVQAMEVVQSDRTLRHVDFLLDAAGPDAPGGRRRLHLAVTADERDFASALTAFEGLLGTIEVDD